MASGFLLVSVRQPAGEGGSKATAAQYEYQLDFNSSQTGYYQVASGAATCEPGHFGDTHTAWMEQPETFQTHVLAIRCGLGTDTNSGFILRKRASPTGPVSVVGNTGSLEPARHPVALPMVYEPDFSYVWGGPGYGITPSEYYTADVRKMFEHIVDIAPTVWDAAVPGKTLFTVGPNPNIVVKLYWEEKNGSYGCLATQIACVAGLYTAHYPHIVDPLTIWIRMPPEGRVDGTGELTEWTAHPAFLSQPSLRQRYFPLPYTMLHEFGHTLGLGHLSPGHVMGVERIWEAIVVPTTSDTHGATEVTKDHH